MKGKFFKLMLVTNKNNTPLEKYLDFIAICAKSGITSVQLREKNLPYDALLEFGNRLQLLLKPFSIPLIINDNAQLAAQLGADGLHLGQSDGNVLEAREQLGNKKIIGLTVNSLQQMYVANTLPINYVGIGAIFPTANKKNINPILGCEDLKKIAAFSRHPVVAIGGINETNALNVMNAGGHGIAGIDVFHKATHPAVVTKKLYRILNGINDD